MRLFCVQFSLVLLILNRIDLDLAELPSTITQRCHTRSIKSLDSRNLVHLRRDFSDRRRRNFLHQVRIAVFYTVSALCGRRIKRLQRSSQQQLQQFIADRTDYH